MPKDESVQKFKETFKEEFSNINDIKKLKEIYASELKKRDNLIEKLRNENKVLLKTAFKSKNS